MTEQATGALSKLIMGFEDVDDFGALATDGFEMPIVSSTLRRSRNKIQSRVIRSNYNPGRPSGGNISVAGQIVVPLDSIASWYWFKAIFNTLTTTGDGPYDHEFKMIGVTKRISMSIEHQFLDLAVPKYFQFTGCKVSGFSFSVGDEGEMLMTMDIVGSDRTIVSSPFDSAPTDLSSYQVIENAHAAFKEGDATFADASNVSFQVNFNPDTSKYLIGGGGTLGAIPDGIMSLSGSNDFLFKDTALLTKAASSTESSIEMTFTKAADAKVNVKLPELEYGEADPGIDGPQGIAVSLPYEAYFDNSSEASSMVVTLTNAEAHV